MAFRFSLRTWWIDKGSQETRTSSSAVLFCLFIYLYSCVCCSFRLVFSACIYIEMDVPVILGWFLFSFSFYRSLSSASTVYKPVIVIADGTLRTSSPLHLKESGSECEHVCVSFTHILKTNPYTFCLCSHSSYGSILLIFYPWLFFTAPFPIVSTIQFVHIIHIGSCVFKMMCLH